MIRRLAGIVLAALVLPGLASGPAAGRIAGIVVEDGVTPARPIRRAIVSVTGTGIAVPLQVLTDDAGRFVVDGLIAGRYSLTAEKPAYIKSYFGSTRIGQPPGMPIALGDGQVIGDISIPVMRGAAIGGTVRESSGVPVSGAQVQVQVVSIVDGNRKLTAPAGIRWATTNDLGEYRLWGLPPGEYVVRAGGGGAPGAGAARVLPDADFAAALKTSPGSTLQASTPLPTTARLSTYFPGVIDPALAQGITLRAGDERLGVDIVSKVGQVARVTGNTVGPDGRPVTNILVGIANVSANSLFSSPGIVRPGANGQFSVAGLTPGRWLLFGSGGEQGMPSDRQLPWWTFTEFVIGDQDVSGLVMQFAAKSRISGKLTFDGSSVRPDLSRMRVSLIYIPPVDGVNYGGVSAAPAADGSFVLDDLAPGKYRVNVSSADPWALRSAVADGIDVFDTPIEVATGRNYSMTMAMTDRTTQITGVLFDQLGRPAPEYSVVVFSADRSLWASPRRNSGLVKLGSDGKYRIDGLPPGEYLLCVVTDLSPAQLNDPGMLERLAGASVRVTLADGEHKVQDFRIPR